MKNNKRIALVIGSGGIKCAAAVGLWRVLQEENIEVESLVGCSGGSLYAALIANDADLVLMQELSSRLWTKEIMQGYT
ncbi:MAG TPA: patatin-like phospholipase family protein, partial [Anaerolineales bacterium]|nr:patatin-like phospholipase family protein [Anaerolineales bacterium]